VNLPYILVVDDQYARDDAERWHFVDDANLAAMEAEAEPEINRGRDKAMAQVAFCSGQRRDKNVIINDYDVIYKAVAARDDWALVLLDVCFDSGPLIEEVIPGGQPGDDSFGEVVSRQLAQDFPNLSVVMLTGVPEQELDNQYVQYLSKVGLGVHELKGCLLDYGRLSSDQIRHLLGLGKDIVAQSERAVSVFREAFIHAEENVSIMILGENGTGKEKLAKYIHEISSRHNDPFIAVNVAAIPKDLLESELFGVGRRVATNVDMRPGKFELANGGSLFLDEIGDMPLDAQAKVLRALQEREITRVGESASIQLDIRLITATSKDIPRMIADGEFREDLFHRINTVPLIVPPLRERVEDILPLAEAFIEKFMAEFKKTGITISSEAKRSLEQHSYSGNVREIENLIKRIISGIGNNRVITGDEIVKVLESSYTTSLASSDQQPPKGSRQHQPSLPTGVSLSELPALLEASQINMNDPVLAGIKPHLENAFKELLQRLAGSALERCRDPVSGELNRQRAMQLLTGDNTLKGKAPARLINEILGRKQEHKVTDEDLETLVAAWKNN